MNDKRNIANAEHKKDEDSENRFNSMLSNLMNGHEDQFYDGMEATDVYNRMDKLYLLKIIAANWNNEIRMAKQLQELITDAYEDIVDE